MNKKELLYPVGSVSAILAYLVLTFPNFYPFPEATTYFVSKMIGLLDYTVINYKNNILINGFNPVAVSSECSGIIILFAFIITIQVMPVFTIFQKVTAILISPAIYLGNLVRIMISLLTGLKGSVPAMIFVHDTVGQIFMFLWAIAIYVAWLRVHSLFPKDIFANKMHHKWHHRTKKKL